jgi:hypothetical protein
MTEVFTCKCKSQKTCRMIMDGGVCGTYELHLCSKCYLKQDKKFLISEERFDKIIIQNPNQKTRILGGRE